jgi:hypothetical protein
MSKLSQTEFYLRRWFIPYANFVERSGGSPAEVEALLEAKVAPGLIYALAPNGDCWSALAAFVGKAQPEIAPEALHFYAPSSLYWLRRALLLLRDGASPEAAAAINQHAFAAQFIAALGSEPLAKDNYPTAFAEGGLDQVEAERLAAAEWKAWVSGGYAVCLRSFTGESCVVKESLARHLRTSADNADISKIEVIDAMERLAVYLMPFAPFERPSGTPGFAIDNLLTAMNLGSEQPYSDAWTAPA